MDLLPRSREEFREKDYWDAFFKKRTKAFEWYGEYTDLCGIFAKYIKPKDNILVAGCGNSKLSLDLFDVGYKNITNVDISNVVIKQMSNQHSKTREGMKWKCMDLKKLEFEDNSFSVVLDKGTTDALLTDDTLEVVKDVRQMFQEASRVLRVGGRFVMVSLLQPHVARVSLGWFHEAGWMVRVCRCQEAEETERREGSLTFPIFVVIATKLKTLPGMKPVLELSFHDEMIRREDSLENVFTEVTALQKFAILQHKLASVVINEENPVVVELVNPGTHDSRYAIYVVDNPDVERTMAVFIVPQGRELEWLFSSVEGRKQLADTAKFGRLLVVHLQRDQTYTDLKTVQEELSAKVMELAPSGMHADVQVPFLSVGNSIGHCVVVQKGESSCSGKYRVEEVEGENGLMRRLVFLSNANAIQSEVRLVRGKARGKRKRVTEDKSRIDTSRVVCEHHRCMVAGLGLLPAAPRVLLIGLGGGTLASYVLNNFPKVHLDCVELDADIVEVAHQWFGLPKCDQLQVHVMDGLEFVSEQAKKGAQYDSVILDVDSKDINQGLSAPPLSFLQKDFLHNVCTILSPSGVCMLNIACRNTKLLQECIDGLFTQFLDIYSYKIPEDVNQVLYCYTRAVNEQDVKKKMCAINREMKRNCKDHEDLLIEQILKKLSKS